MAKNKTEPSVAIVVGAISNIASAEVAQPIKKYPITTVDGKDNTMPAIFLLARSAKKLKRAITIPPTKKDVISCI